MKSKIISTWKRAGVLVHRFVRHHLLFINVVISATAIGALPDGFWPMTGILMYVLGIISGIAIASKPNVRDHGRLPVSDAPPSPQASNG
jgi:hypothetical protein